MENRQPTTEQREIRGDELADRLLDHKLGIALKECREARYWLRVIHRAKMLSENDLPVALLSEVGELCAILGQSILTARSRTQ